MVDAVSNRRMNTDRPGILDRLLALFRFAGDKTLRHQLEHALESNSAESAAFTVQERLMLRNILGFREVRVDDVMVPRVDIIAVDQNANLDEILAIFKDAGHSRLPLFNDTLDEPTGMVHIKDLMGWLTSQASGKASASRTKKSAGTGSLSLDFSKADLGKSISSIKIARPMMFVPPSMPAIDLLKKMQTTRIHLALVVDEYGGTEGLVSIEDLVEEIVGEIDDEHDPLDTLELTRSDDGSYIADARVLIEDFQDEVGKHLDLESAEDDVDTLGGLVFSLTGRIPVRGELVSGPEGLEFEVLDVDTRRIKKLKIYRKSRAGRNKPAAKSQKPAVKSQKPA
ncbi:MAG: hemolysin family protein [Fimbriimonadaceae bacterium]|nr:hemolysin family protein [Alphaproteobacteria bacterium]